MISAPPILLRYLCGDQLSLADVRLFTTLIRFDAVYHGLFKCNVRRVSDYHNVDNYVRELYQMDAFGRLTTFIEHIKKCYYYSMVDLNPNRVGGLICDIHTVYCRYNYAFICDSIVFMQIVPSGPELDLKRKHDRKDVGK